jgi:PKD repeat protein
MFSLISKKLGITFIGVALFFSSFQMANAEIASLAEMTQVCQNWLSQVVSSNGDWGGSANPQIINSFDIINNGTPVGRYFEIAPSGFVAVPILKEMVPIKAYSEESRLDFSEPEGISALLTQVIASQISDYTKLYGSPSAPQTGQAIPLFSPTQRETWNYFLQNDKTFQTALNSKAKAAMTTIGPLLTTSWHQNAPYYNSCPSGDGGRTVVGCVATAASQIMAYHRWPLVGKGTKSYYWGGDVSCNGSSPGQTLKANYNDPYDWANIPNSCTSTGPLAQRNALAELCYEVGIAFNMEYGRCGSGAYTADAVTVFPQYFRYMNSVTKSDRINYLNDEWSSLIRAEMEAGRPAQYRIMSHSIVCDGWQDSGTEVFYHMNYGWGGSQTAWFAIDNLYCTWDGCAVSEEFIITGINPDRRAYFTADTAMGYLPLTVNFAGLSSFAAVDNWIWSFGDGDSSFVQSPTHIYNQGGRYTVTFKAISGTDTGTYVAENYIAALNDSISSNNVQAFRNSVIEIVINGHNITPLKRLVIPVTYAGSLGLQFVDYSVVGCRTEYFDLISQPSFDGSNNRMAFVLDNTNLNEPDLPLGSGPLIKLYFSIPGSATISQNATISFDSYSSYSPVFSGSDMSYTPILAPGMVSIPFICGDADRSGSANLLDISYIIKYLYRGGPAPNPPQSSDADNNGKVNLLDVSRIINALYHEGLAPVCHL